MSPLVRMIAVRSLVLPYVDVAIATLGGVASKQLKRLQTLLNSSIRHVYGLKRRHAVSPLLKKHGWLCADARVDFRVLCLVYLATQGVAPKFITSLVEPYSSQRALRSSSSAQLAIPFVSTSTGARAFSVRGPRLWNGLPMELRQASTYGRFRKLLADYLL